ncbi:hypothetical protein [Salmonella phage SD-2_S15]|nr:hypothetical protein [Salmonella phage SD-2_S15]
MPSSKQDVDFPLGLLQASVLLHVGFLTFFKFVEIELWYTFKHIKFHSIVFHF